MKKIVSLLFINLICTIGFSQNNPFTMPTIIPISPEAKGIGKFGDVPVGNYTGTPDISIPIYTVKAGKLSLPITLSYHATGIEVAQEATWVGLGWNLVAGGTITYIPVGGNDQSSSGINPDAFQGLLKYLDVSAYPGFKQEDGLVGWSCVHSDEMSKIITTDMIGPLQDGIEEQDVYSANFLNYSFKFIKHPINGSYFFMGQKNKCLINGGGLNGFVITGEDGTIYHFDGIEKNLFPTSWLLTKMIGPTGDTITLKYKNAITYNLPPLSELYTKKEKAASSNRIITGAFSNYVMYLDTIETRNELIVFESDPNRSDLTGAYRLTRVTIKDKVNQVEKFSYRFVYDYFTGSNVGGDYLNDDQNGSDQSSFSDISRKNRLRLDSLIQVSNNLANDKYAFSYYESVPLPRKTSFAMDYWGYYNGQENSSPLITGKNHTIVPNILPLITGNPLNYGGFDNSFYPLKGATRGASKNIAIATAGMLKSIQYPTKGKTVFTYEPHDYSNYKYYSLEEAPLYQVSVINDDVEVRAWGITPYPVTNVTQSTFRLTSGADVTLSGYSDFSGGALTIEGDSVPGGFTPLVYAISDPNPVGHLAEWNDKKIWLNPGKYTLKCDTPPSYTRSDDMYPEIWGKVIYGQRYYYQSDTSRSYHILGGLGGGLRIKTIVSYDENNKVVSSKKYSYVDESGNPSGKLLIPLQNFDLREKTVGVLVEDYGWYHNYTACTLYGSSYVSLSGYLTGNNVGYNRVVVESYNSSGVTKGKEISYYDNSPGSLYFGKIPFFSGANNGSLLKKIILNTDGDTLLTEKSNYGMLNGTDSSVTVNVYAEDLYEGPTDVCLGEGGDNPLAYSTRYHIYAYPTRNYYNALSSKETTHYFQNGKVKETTSYTYNPKNFCLQSTTETTSKGVKYTNIKYPVDYSGFIYNFMVSQNRISEPVEKVDSVNASTKFKVTTDYDIWNVNLLCAPKKISSTKGSNVQDDRILFGGYDKYGNLLEVQQSNNIKECYYYGYNSSMPVVKGVNIDTAILYPKIRQAIKSSGYSNIDDLLKAVKTFPNTAWNTFNSYLRSLCPDNLITTYTCDPLFGMTSSTDPNGLVTSYEYDLFGRLKLVRDKDGKILKTYEYHYKNQ